MDDQLTILKNFPLLIPLTRDFTVYDGFIRIKDTDFRISLNVPHYPELTNVHLECSWLMSSLLRGKENDLLKLTQTCTSLHGFLEALQTLTFEQMDSNQEMSSATTAAYARILEELAAVSPSCISELSVAQQRVILKVSDGSARDHHLLLTGIGEPTGPRVSADLPLQALGAIRAKGQTVASLYKAFCQQVVSLQQFWSVMEEVDSCCWVIDPEEPHRSDTGRRIIIGENISVQLLIDPWDPNSRPDIKFLGPQKTVSVFRDRLINNLEIWNPEYSLVENLRSILGIDSFPEKPIYSDQNETCAMIRPGECFVCFSVRLEGSLPSEACASEQCGSIFHKDCLYQLLLTLPDSHRGFNRISGECPNCGTAISCPIPG